MAYRPSDAQPKTHRVECGEIQSQPNIYLIFLVVLRYFLSFIWWGDPQKLFENHKSGFKLEK